MSYKVGAALLFGALMFLAGHFTGTWELDAKWWMFCVTTFAAICFLAGAIISDLTD